MRNFKNFVMPIKALLCVVIPFVLSLITVSIFSLGISVVFPVTFTDVVTFPLIIVAAIVLYVAYSYVTVEWLFD
jgi:hydrogenase/urease accessory protein HupE